MIILGFEVILAIIIEIQGSDLYPNTWQYLIE